MSELTIINTTEHAAHLTHGRAARKTISANGRHTAAADETHTVFATMETSAGHELRSNTLVLRETSMTVTATELADNSAQPLEIAATPGPHPDEIYLVSHCAFPVTFFISAG